MEYKLSKYACKYESAERFFELEEDFRNPFFRDIDRVLYSLAYLRYSDKTQVFSLLDNAHVTRRNSHVQYVSKIARTIGRELLLNEDLIEASALAHDVGHTPFGHVGERILNKIALENNIGYFNHNVHGVRVLSSIENYGKGLNLSYQVLDAVLTHNGEIYLKEYAPKQKTKEEFLSVYNSCYEKENVQLIPCTLEGCVVRVSDIISYVGKDLEDAIRLGVIDISKVPKNIIEVLGDSNRKIINTIINDIINNSRGKNYIKISDDIFSALMDLKKFNYKNIYDKSYSSVNSSKLEEDFKMLFKTYLDDIVNNNEKSNIVSSYLANMCCEYKKNAPEVIVVDYIAGMTDSYFKKEVEKNYKK